MAKRPILRTPNDRFGSEADILGHLDDVRFTPESGPYSMQL
jgi:hypothetical protein